MTPRLGSDFTKQTQFCLNGNGLLGLSTGARTPSVRRLLKEVARGQATGKRVHFCCICFQVRIGGQRFGGGMTLCGWSGRREKGEEVELKGFVIIKSKLKAYAARLQELRFEPR